MPYSLSVWLDDKTAGLLEMLSEQEERSRSSMVKVLIRKAAKKNQFEIKEQKTGEVQK